ncbi:2-keto-4-pentenoate hydratase [Fructilactobacillus carniphilus]|uniref:2-keto-4-pentenoate hydratase n=1 Tax=Fructilactobacillus carniphilus TaxID=2940297 RepID=A0ABY5BXU3_9LACO|nr:2-keto-4-pentenoate hydratase [Fructilactobacillus carniphilus]USS91339.1 2-keto-4-pentenoate hydratase [Fructilactobacillus carniphilus]
MTDQVANADQVEVLAQILYQAYADQEPLEMADFPTFSDEQAYQVQDRLMKLKQHKRGGYKISLTSAETQSMFDATEPLYGAQLDERFFRSGAQLPASLFLAPLVEVELVFTAQADLSVQDDLEDLLERTTIAPAVEIPDCRFRDWFPKLPKHLVIADAAVGGAVVYGKEMPGTNFQLAELAEVNTKLFHDQEQVATGTSSEVLGNPVKSLRWLVQKLASRGQQLRAGEHVSTGTFLLPVPLTKGHWRADFDHQLGSVEFDVK